MEREVEQEVVRLKIKLVGIHQIKEGFIFF